MSLRYLPLKRKTRFSYCPYFKATVHAETYRILFLVLENMCLISALENNVLKMLMLFPLDIGSYRNKSKKMTGNFMVKMKHF